jgi:transposase-like protein
MSTSTISTFELFQLFPDEEAARKYIEARRWPDGVHCPYRGCLDNITPRRDGFYRCNSCKKDFTVRTGTIYERSHIPLHKWLYAMYMLMTPRKGVSSVQIAKLLGITQKSAWFMLGRLREACGNDKETLRGTVEVDEMFVGGSDMNRRVHQRMDGRGAVGKTPVLGIRERGGRTKAKPVKDSSSLTLQGEIRATVEPGSTIHIDELSSYKGLARDYTHELICHSAVEYARDGVTTDGVESVWAVMKRGLVGVYHHASPKHLHRYVNEFTFRLNDGTVKRHTMQRLHSLTEASFGHRLTYEASIG